MPNRDEIMSLSPGDKVMLINGLTNIPFGSIFTITGWDGPNHVKVEENAYRWHYSHFKPYVSPEPINTDREPKIVGYNPEIIIADDLPVKSDGGSTAYYELPEWAEQLGDLIDYKKMNFNVGNIFKACYRLGEKVGNSRMYDLKKILWFVQREIANEERSSEHLKELFSGRLPTRNEVVNT